MVCLLPLAGGLAAGSRQSLTAGETEVRGIVRFTPSSPRSSLAEGRPAERAIVLSSRRRATEAALARLAPWLRKAGARELRPLWAIHGAALTLPASRWVELARQAGVARIQTDRALRLAPDHPAWLVRRPAPGPRSLTGEAATQPALEALGLPQLWAAGVTGEGVTVALLDTGVDLRHPALGPRWRGGPGAWFDPVDGAPLPEDEDGHGTAVLGLILGDEPGGPRTGAAPGAHWIAARVFDARGETRLSTLHQAWQWAVDPDDDPTTADGPAVVNASWAFVDQLDRCSDEFAEEFALLRGQGTAIVFSAGNAGPDPASSLPPANSPAVLAIGALDEQGLVDRSSSRGPSPCGGLFPTLVAPGIGLLTTDLTLAGEVPDAYALVDGSSFSAPLVSGGLALLRGAEPGASLVELERAVSATARDLGPAGPDPDHGSGLPDFAAAARRLTPPPGANAPPRTLPDSYAVRWGHTVRLTPLQNDRDDDDGDAPVPSTLQLVEKPGGAGRLVQHGDGTLDYTPGKGARGFRRLRYRVADRRGAWSAPTLVRLRVGP